MICRNNLSAQSTAPGCCEDKRGDGDCVCLIELLTACFGNKWQPFKQCYFWKQVCPFVELKCHSCLQIRYWSVHEKEAAPHIVQVMKQNFSVRLENLKPNTHYRVNVAAFNNAGPGPTSPILSFTTEKARK